MSLKIEPATSIHRRLLMLLLPPLALLMLAGGFADYRASMVFMRTAYDQSLADAAFAQAARIKVERRQDLRAAAAATAAELTRQSCRNLLLLDLGT